MEQNNLLTIVESWQKVIDNFKKRSDVISGSGLGWKGSKGYSNFEDTPEGFGSATGTTGWCVSASEALLYDEVFQLNLQSRNARAKLISIDIKEQYYGFCYNGSQNKWHTAILLEDSNFNIVIDITCRQFGNDFLNKDIWDFNTWQTKLRSPFCKHNITDFNNNPQNINPILTETFNNSDSIADSLILHKLKNITNIVDSERLTISDFFINKINSINKKLLLNNISVIDYKYIIDITKQLQNLPFNTIKQGYSVLSFETKESAKNWIKLFLEDNAKLPMYLTISDSIENSCKYNLINKDELNLSNNLSVEKNKTFVIFEFGTLFGIDTEFIENTSILLPYGLELFVNSENIYNSGKNISGVENNVFDERQTNTIIIKVDNMV